MEPVGFLRDVGETAERRLKHGLRFFARQIAEAQIVRVLLLQLVVLRGVRVEERDAMGRALA